MLFLPLFFSIASAGLFGKLPSVKDLTDTEAFALAESVKKSSDQRIVILMEYASWCPHCQRAAAPFSDLARKFSDPRIAFVGVDCADFPKFCESEEYKINGFPTLRILARGVNTVLNRSKIFEDKAVQYLTDLIVPIIGEIQLTAVEKRNEAQPDHRWSDEPSTAFFRRADAAEAVRVILRLLVRNSEILDATRTSQVLDFLKIIGNTFPKTQLRLDAREISGKLPPPGRQIEEFHKLLDSTGLFASRGVANFSHCRVFSCALWQLFHILAASANLVWADGSQSSSPSDVLLFTRSTVENFFNCDECKNHYLSDFDASVLDRPQLEKLGVDEESKASVEIWLWAMHNSVSARVSAEHGFNDPRGVWSHWPAACADCNADSALAELRRNYWDAAWLNEPSPMRLARVGYRLIN